MTNHHDANFYFGNFKLDYNYNELNQISNTLKVLVEAKDIHGFGIYTKKNTSDKMDEFTIVLKTSKDTGKNWLMMRYTKTSANTYHRIQKQCNLGPKALYAELKGPTLNYVIDLTNPAYQIANLSIIIRDASIVAPYWEGVNIEYQIGNFDKYGGNRQISRKKYIRKNKKRSYVSKKNLKGGYKVIINKDAENVIIEVKYENMTLGDLKNIIALPYNLNIPTDQQTVMLLGQELTDDSKFLKEIGIADNSKLQITKKTKDLRRAVWS